MPATGEMRALTVVFAIPKSSRILARHEECAETGPQSIGAHQSDAQAFVSATTVASRQACFVRRKKDRRSRAPVRMHHMYRAIRTSTSPSS
jgi:hypothetical protein